MQWFLAIVAVAGVACVGPVGDPGLGGGADASPELDGSDEPVGGGDAGNQGAPDAGGGGGGGRDAAASPPDAAGDGPGQDAATAGACRAPATVDIPAWGINNSGVYVRKGEAITITATGTWLVEGKSYGPAGSGGAACDNGLWVRVGKFFDRQCVGNRLQLTAQRDGYLWFFQKTIAVGFHQQVGSLEVTITGGDTCSAKRPEGMLAVDEDPAFDKKRLERFEPACGSIPVLFDTDSPSNPRVQQYIKEFLHGDPHAFMKRAVLAACAVNYETPELAAHHGRGTMRLVHYLGAQKWEDLGRPKHRDAQGREYWDFALSFKVAELDEGLHYGPFGVVPSTFLHEAGHVLSPEGRVRGVPRWLNETYADLLAAKIGLDHHGHDNPENWVLYGRQSPYCDGYNTGVLFLDAMDRRFPGFIHRLSAFIVAQTTSWPGSDAAFRAASGQGLNEAYEEYLREYGLTLKKPVAMCDFPNDIP